MEVYLCIGGNLSGPSKNTFYLWCHMSVITFQKMRYMLPGIFQTPYRQYRTVMLFHITSINSLSLSFFLSVSCHMYILKRSSCSIVYYTFICLYMFFNIYVLNYCLDTMQYFIYRNTSIWLVNYKLSLLLSILSELCNKHSDTYQQTVKQPVTVLSFFYIYIQE